MPILFTFISIEAFAQRDPEKLERLKTSSPYCVDKIEKVNKTLFWSISNSCYMLKNHLPKRELASISKVETKIERNQIESKKERTFLTGFSANQYDTDVNTTSLAVNLGYKKDITESYEVILSGEIEKFLTISSNQFEAEIENPRFNASLIGLKKINHLKFGVEFSRKHFIQTIDKPTEIEFSLTSFLALGGIIKYALSESIELGGSASYLKASDDLNSKGYDLKAFGSYNFKNYSIVPSLTMSSIENSYQTIKNTKIGTSFQITF